MPELDVETPYQVNVRAVPIERAAIHPSGNVAVLVPVPGPPGATGAPGDGAQIVGEQLAGTLDGTNTVFTTSQAYAAGSTAVYRNGLRETSGVGYAETDSTTITFDEAPIDGDDIRIDYTLA